MSQVGVVRPGGATADEQTLHAWGGSASTRIASSSHSLAHDLDTQAQASRANVESAVASCRLVLFFAHGQTDRIESGPSTVLDTLNVAKASGTIVMAMSCDTARTLGPHSITSGVDTYLGFDDLVHWLDAKNTSVASEQRTGDAWIAGMEQLLQPGTTVRAAKQTIEAALDQMVADFAADLRAGGDPDNAYAYACAFWNRHHLRLDGNGGATL